MSSGFSAQRISQEARRQKQHKAELIREAEAPDVIYLCHQIVDLHFPEHYGEVYARILPTRGYTGRITAFVQDEETEIARNMRKNGAILLPRHPVGSVFARLKQYFILFYRLLKLLFSDRGWKQARFFVAHNDPVLGLFAWTRARLNKGVFIYRITHLMAEEAAQDKRRSRRVAAWLYRYVRNWLIRRADAVMPMSPEMGRVLCEQTGISPDRVHPVVSVMDVSNELTPDQSDRVGELRDGILKKLEAAGCKKWLVYVGTVNPFRELDFLIDVLAAVRTQDQDAGLLLLGKVNRWSGTLDKLREYARRRGVEEQVVIADPVPSWALPGVLNVCDAGLSPFPPNPVLRCNSPLKTLEYIRAGLPVVASAIPDHEDYVEQAGAGFVVPHEPDLFADAVVRLLQEDAHIHDQRSRAIRKWLAANRSLSNAADVFEGVFRDLDNKRRKAG